MSGRHRRLFVRLVLLASPLVLLVLVGFISLTSNSEDTFQGTPPGSVHPQQQQQLSNEELQSTQRQLQQLKDVISQLEDQLRQQQSHNDRKDTACTSNYIQKQIQKSELERGKEWHNEYEIIPHSLFTLNAFYPTEPGLGRRVVERPLASRRQDLQEAISSALSILNAQQNKNDNSKGSWKRYTANDLIEGLYRIDPIEGTEYEFWFQPSKNKGTVNYTTDLMKVTLLRPHAPLTAVRVGNEESPKSTINIIVPLAGRLTAFKSFLARFQRIIVSSPESDRIHLTIVFFGDTGWEEIRSEMLAFEKLASFNNFHLLNVNATFSRARGVQMGIEHWEGPANEDVLLFVCDVDVDFDAQFLQRCRRNTKPQRQAYFPMVFSLYNPNITGRLVYNQGSDNQQPLLSKETGFWRDFGFGMVCTYMSDFLSLWGFRGYSHTGWGGEDLYLYRKYIRSSLRVIRSPDPNLFHIWHPKSCPDSLGVVQKRSCLQSRARNEASHDQLGLLFFLTDDASNRQTEMRNNR